jgi:hypothetical protein
LRGADVQTANGAKTVGKMEKGDTLTFLYSQQVNLTTITAGWTGASLPVSVRVRDGGLVSLTGQDDTLDVSRSGSAVNLGSTNLKQDYVKAGRTVTANATMTASTVTTNGVVQTKVTLTLDTPSASSDVRTATVGANMVWTPSPAVTDLSGKPCSSFAAVEIGVLDLEF